MKTLTLIGLSIAISLAQPARAADTISNGKLLICQTKEQTEEFAKAVEANDARWAGSIGCSMAKKGTKVVILQDDGLYEKIRAIGDKGQSGVYWTALSSMIANTD